MSESWAQAIFAVFMTFALAGIAWLFTNVSRMKTKIAVINSKLDWVDDHKEDFIIIRHSNGDIQSDLAIVVRNQDTLFKKLDREKAKVQFLMNKIQVLKSKAEKLGANFDDDFEFEDLT
jgi:hypothetical protein